MPRTTTRAYGQLTRSAIVDAAVAHLARSDAESMTIRKLATDLGVSPMALYRHVASKDDVLLEVTDRMLTDAGLPSPASGWRRCLLELAGTLRALLSDHPALVSVFNRGPVTTPAAVARMERAVQVLERDGFTPDAAIEAYAAVHTYTIGFGTIAAARRANEAAAPAAVDGPAAVIGRFITPRQYQVGLDTLLAGLEERLARDGLEGPSRPSGEA